MMIGATRPYGRQSRHLWRNVWVVGNTDISSETSVSPVNRPEHQAFRISVSALTISD